MNDILYIGFSDNEKMAPLVRSKYGKALELRIIDCPASEQGRLLQQLKDIHFSVSPSFMTVDEADQELKEYRQSLIQELLGNDVGEGQ